MKQWIRRWWLVLIGASLSSAVCAQIPAAQPEVAIAEAAEVTYESLLASLPINYRSAMLYPKEQEKIRIVMDAIKNDQPLPNVPAAQPTDQPNQPPPPLTSYTYPQFYLTSIVYHAPDQWAVWINHRKITAQKQAVIPNLTIASINKDRVVLAYDFSSDPKIKPTSDSADPRININFEKRNVQATLETNQTFSLYSWQVFEGHVPTVTQNFAPEEKSTLDAIVDGAAEIAGPLRDPAEDFPLDQDADRTGQKNDIGSLLNQYKHLEGDL